jgi:type II secretory pathway pseudopilin PulG
MQKKKCKKRSITLIEILVVMSLIAIITGALAYNYQGAIEKGKAFKTEELIKRIETILSIKIAEYPDKVHEIEHNWTDFVKKSPLWTGSDNIEDGWGGKITMNFERDPTDGELKIKGTSKRLDEYRAKH